MIPTSRISMLIFAVVFMMMAGCTPKDSSPAVSDANASATTSASKVTMTIDAKEHLQPDTLEIEIKEGMKLAEALREAKGMTFELETFEGLGTLVKGINGLNNNQHEGHYWQYCLDGTYVDRGIDELVLKSGQQVSWYYRAYGETPCKKIGE